MLRAVPASFLGLTRPGSGQSPGGAHRLQRGGTQETGPESLLGLVTSLPPELMQRALTHSSWVEARTVSYERLEFLGDSVLGLAIASALYERFPEREEGGLARLKAFVVSRASCVQVAERMGLATLVLEHAPASERKRRDAARSPTMLGDMLEAVIGAVYLHHGFERARPAIVSLFEEQMEYAATAHVDHKTALQELLAPRGVQPAYRLVEEAGPAHARIFTSEVSVSERVRGRGVGTTIKMSEQAAAQEALADLEPKPQRPREPAAAVEAAAAAEPAEAEEPAAPAEPAESDDTEGPDA